MFFISVVKILCIVTLIENAKGQNTEGTNTTPGNNTGPPSSKILLCSKNGNDTLSTLLCSCEEAVVSCDFSKYSDTRKRIISLDGQLLTSKLKRLCICNAPKNLLVNLTSDLIPKREINMHRLDLYNVSGPVRFHNAFKEFFAGDLYIANLSAIYKLHSWEFGRGYDLHIEDVEDLECCSKIKSSPIYTKPTLHIENSNIEKIESNAINSLHLWKTVVLKRIFVSKEVQHIGIHFQSTDAVNVSITHSKFNNVNDSGILVNNFENMLIEKNLIYNSSEKALEIHSAKPNSTLVIIDNYFANAMTWHMDAQTIVNWFNLYDVWYHGTFIFLNRTSFKNRTFSIEYNSVNDYIINETSSLPLLEPEDNVIFNENILGKCNCSEMRSTLIPEILSRNPSRCDSTQTVDSNLSSAASDTSCLISYKDALNTCFENSILEKNLTFLCQNSSISVNRYHAKSIYEVKTAAMGLLIDSVFIKAMMQDMKGALHQHQVSAHDESLEERNSRDTGAGPSVDKPKDPRKQRGAGGHTTTVVILVIIAVSLFAGSAFGFLYKKRRFLLRRGRDESYDNLMALPS